MVKKVWILILVSGICGEGRAMHISTPAFDDGSAIPSIYTCEGKDSSPELRIFNVPENAKSLVLICDDPDAPDPKAPKMTWVHWVVFNLPPTVTQIPAKADLAGLFPGCIVGINSWHKNKYGGPCPPIGSHRYYFKLYALKTKLDLGPSATKDDVVAAMEGAIVAQAQLMGRYEKKKP